MGGGAAGRGRGESSAPSAAGAGTAGPGRAEPGEAGRAVAAAAQPPTCSGAGRCGRRGGERERLGLSPPPRALPPPRHRCRLWRPPPFPAPEAGQTGPGRRWRGAKAPAGLWQKVLAAGAALCALTLTHIGGEITQPSVVLGSKPERKATKYGRKIKLLAF